ncbi:MAG: hypothetical protein IPM59_05390 [Chloracidobacterium sp.]|nr:hypothetical protein [Chloracidobacterium sp.]
MELEFDKEIDAILRKTRADAASSMMPSGVHLDADAVAAFVENTLPDKAKHLYIEHFADCGPCRKLLTQSILINQTAATTAAGAAEVLDAVNVIPWYSRFFRAPSLALVMGAMVIAFSGVLGYLVLQNRESQNATVSQVANRPIVNSPYSTSGSAASDAANATAANTSANTSEPAPMDAPPRGIANSGTGPSVSGDGVIDDRFAGAQPEAPRAADKPLDLVTSESKPPPPAAAPREQPAAVGGLTREEAASERKDEDASLAKGKAAALDSGRRDMPAAPAKSGPARASGPVQMQSNQVNAQTFEMAVSRKVGGRTFENRNGAWYDSKYTGQATTNIRRGTDEFTKLDSGLRKIAKELNGVVVVLWKEKAYRIN